jgi:hypothetical protein
MHLFSESLCAYGSIVLIRVTRVWLFLVNNSNESFDNENEKRRILLVLRWKDSQLNQVQPFRQHFDEKPTPLKRPITVLSRKSAEKF